MHQSLQEFTTSHGASLRVDRQSGVIRGVKILGLASRNGRRYSPPALRDATALYEGAKVNINHPKGSPLAPRDYQERIGVLRNVEFREQNADAGGLFGDLHYNPGHLLAEQLAWDAENEPANVGLSHNVLAVVTRQGDDSVVESISKVQSVDLVADPATTRGLFEQVEPTAEQQAHWFAALSVEDLRTRRNDLVASLLEEARLEHAELQRRIDELSAAQTISRRRDALRTLLAEYKLPDPSFQPGSAVITEQFIETAMLTPDDAAMRALVAERANLLRAAAHASISAAPMLCREQSSGEFSLTCADAHSFAKAIRA